MMSMQSSTAAEANKVDAGIFNMDAKKMKTQYKAAPHIKLFHKLAKNPVIKVKHELPEYDPSRGFKIADAARRRDEHRVVH